MGKSIAVWVSSVFGSSLGKVLGVGFISMLPIIELRGAIPIGYALGLNWQSSFIISVIGNMLPIPFILLFVEAVFKFMKKHNILTKFVTKLEDKATLKSDSVTKYQFWGLMIFVAIPLPGTGGWTGALIASVMKMKKSHALLSIFLGVLVAAVIVTMLTYGLVDNFI